MSNSTVSVRHVAAALVLACALLAPFGAAQAQATTATNTATVAPPTGVTDPDTTNNTATDSDAIARTSNLSLAKTASAATVTVGGNIVYTLTVTNNGPSAIPGSSTFSLQESLPAGLSSCTYTPSAGTFTVGTIAPGTSGTGTWTGVTLPGNGSQATLQIQCTVTAAAAASITNTATVLPPAGTSDPDCAGTPLSCSGGNTGTVTTAVTRPQLTLTKTASASSFTVGVAASYTLSVQNTGTAATTAVATISDTIPTGLTIGTLPGGCTAAGQVVTCTIAAGLAANEIGRAHV